MVTSSETRAFLKEVYTDFSEKNVSFMAAGIAYSAFVSLAPLLILLFLALTLVGGGLETRIVELANQWLPGPIAEIVQQIFVQQSGTGGASVIGLVVLIWGALKIFRGLDTAFSEIYETADETSFASTLTDGIIVLFALGVAVLATVGTTVAFAAFSETIPFSGLLMPFVLLGGLVIAFLPMYYVFPDRDLRVRDALPGAVVAAVGWALFQSLFQLYLTVSDPGAGGFAGGIIVLITYLYFSAQVLLVGAVINAVLGGHSSGQPGGFGEGARSQQTRRTESFTRAELGAYLRSLDERLTTTYSGGRDDEELPPQPDGDVQLVEYTTDQGQRWTVELSWHSESDPGADDAEEPVSRRDAVKNQ